MKKTLFVLMVLVLAFAISCTPQVEHKHTNIEKVLDKEPTNKEEGRYQYVCKDCKEVVSTEVISKLRLTVHHSSKWMERILSRCLSILRRWILHLSMHSLHLLKHLVLFPIPVILWKSPAVETIFRMH